MSTNMKMNRLNRTVLISKANWFCITRARLMCAYTFLLHHLKFIHSMYEIQHLTLVLYNKHPPNILHNLRMHFKNYFACFCLTALLEYNYSCV